MSALLDDLIAAAADPLGASLVVERLRGAGQPVSPRIDHDPLLARAVIALADASRSLTEAVVRTPHLLVVVDHLVERDKAELVLDANDAVTGLEDRVSPADALRRWERREYLRIALRDLLGLTDLAGVGRELAALADACLDASLRVADPQTPMAVIAMGKLGGEELNYASDVDVLFVHDGDEFAAAKAARRLIAMMSEPTAEGIVFRTDADLRPDGKAGPLSRTVNAYADYYGGRALTWERQALLKARFVTGDAELAQRWFSAIDAELWGRPRPADAVRDIRAHKVRAEQHLAREGLSEREVKRGRGGIRDVEMAVQILQFVHGGGDPAIRSRTTLVALEQLARRGYIDEADAEHLSVAYRYLRTVEHRLQLEREQQVYALPAEQAALDRLARVMGYRDRDDRGALEQFLDSHHRHQDSVRSIFERLFFRPLLEALSGRSPWQPERLEGELAALGFQDLVATRAAVEELTAGASRHAVQLRLLFPQLLEWLSAAPNPDLGLLQLRTVLDGPARAMTVMPLLRQHRHVAEALCTVLASSKVAGQGLRRNPEAVRDLLDLELLARPRTRDELRHDARTELEDIAGGQDIAVHDTARPERLRRFTDRERTRIVLRHLLTDRAAMRTDEYVGVAGELSDLADVVVDTLLWARRPAVPFAVIAMGKHGGRELAFSSDLDVIFVHDGEQPDGEAVAQAVLREIGGPSEANRSWEIDARLRPEGNQGVLARSLGSYRRYYADWAQTWERQALIKARCCAGDPALGAAFEALRDEVTFGRPLTGEERAELQHIKRRVETERVRGTDDRTLHLKLGPGGMVDVEFTVQLLQLAHGHADPSLRSANTMAALAALVDAGHVEAEDAAALRASYRFCDLVRNALYLRSASKRDVLPTDAQQRRDLDRILELDDAVATYRSVAEPAREVVQRLFYDRGSI
ncbi:MAG: bifunctional [glutamine synthetase] adenylyltransferase/[glutamine synthetase]-adenylyl-L-tyrosine phosphorylase [Acidimicrobiales bacterium]|nr:bifunctional [glutamine synthetase] adenylyltransferase/[glutamine synthetase]-adenylyl-L-tyrosine phosphorylase [Acidimicrobiales bacterium]